MNRKGISAYKNVKKKSYGSMSQHALTMAIFKEIHKNLELCNLAFVKRKELGLTNFLAKKGATLSKAAKCVQYMIDTADRSAAEDTVDVYDKIYNYILGYCLYANKHMDHDAVKKALLMSKELIKIWDSIPKEYQ